MSNASRDALELVKALMALPENSICADCKKKAAKWASSTLGVFICIDCSGIHRSLGTHISFVRSCTLDSWTPEQARLMRRVGNKVGNEYWEARLPPEFMRPNSCDRASMEAFIRAKYAEGRWAGPGTPPHLRTGRAGAATTGPRSVANMYDGYFQHANQQPQPQRSSIMGGPPVNRHLIGSKSVEFGRKQVAQEAPAGPRETHTGMGLSEFMKGFDKKEEQPVDFSGEDSKNLAPPSTDDSSSFDFMKGESDPEVPEAEAPVEPSPVTIEAKPEVEVKRNPVPIAKPTEKKVDFSNASGSTAMEIMSQGQQDGGAAPAAGSKKQRLFQKKKGASRFAKKPGAPKQGGNMIDQMLDFSQEARYRPVSAPVMQGGPAAAQVGYYGGAPQQQYYGYGAPQQQYRPQQQQQQSPYGHVQLNHFVPNAHQQRQYEMYQQQQHQQQQEQQYQSEYSPLAYPDPGHRTSF